ncbi:putative MFS family arabinose efflux permease [Salirhabdus euzebyi]|uniref:Putative MFS family arabinose efflux permease n=1 Tax=Salirhabdus euzebyi TaxID=394506 RepID=A0A841PSF1_9BACI|nr:MFS transporter [Salirhabdus euzebyi]MBB6451739.1 putative MFS family arabinose efflux permease [Salirhabdus euzebyi]
MSPKHKKEKFPYYITFLLISGIFLVGSDELILSPLLPELVHDFKTTFSLASLSVSLYGLSIGLVVPFIAPYIDRIPRGRLMGLSLLGFAITTLLCASSPTIMFLLVTRFLSGLFAGIYIPSAYAYVGDHVPYQYRGRVMGIVLSGWSLALIVGIPLGAFIGEVLHWRWIFILIGIISVAVSFLTFSSVKTKLKEQQAIIQIEGFFKHLLLALKEKQVGILIFTTFCNMFGFYGIYTFIGTYIQKSYEVNISESGGIILFYGFGIALSPLTGLIVDRFGKKVSLTSAMFSLCLILVVIGTIKLSLLLLCILFVIWGALQSIVLTSISSLLTDQSSELRGRIMSLYSLATNLAVACGSFTMGIFYHTFGFHLIGIICGLVTGLGGVIFAISQLRIKIRRGSLA